MVPRSEGASPGKCAWTTEVELPVTCEKFTGRRRQFPANKARTVPAQQELGRGTTAGRTEQSPNDSAQKVSTEDRLRIGVAAGQEAAGRYRRGKTWNGVEAGSKGWRKTVSGWKVIEKQAW